MVLRAVGLLSPGEMGHVVGQVLIDHDLRVVTCLEGRSERTQARAQKAGIESVPTFDHLVQDADLILSILVPAEAPNAADTVARALEKTGEQIVYVDCNAIAPATAKKIDQTLTTAGSRFVDAGIIGPPPRREGATRFYTSGPDTSAFEALSEYGLDVRPVGSEIGQASGFKMSYAALTKGTAALSTELLVAAKRMGLYDALVEEFQISQAARFTAMEGSLPGIPNAAGRWIGEMEEIAKTFGDLGLTPKIYQGAADMYRFVNEAPLKDETTDTRRTLEQTIEILAERLEGEN